jgi:hypothetical protein
MIENQMFDPFAESPPTDHASLEEHNQRIWQQHLGSESSQILIFPNSFLPLVGCLGGPRALW